MEHKLATAEKRVLVDLVKLVQKKGLDGELGGWKDFLNVHDKKFGASVSDPSRRSSDVLIAFLNTFKKKEDIQLLAKVLQCNANRELIEKFKEESPDKETPEQRLVRMTIEHPSYPVDYAFESYKKDWFITEIGKKSKVMKSTRMLAIDCEMVTCNDGEDHLVKVGAVDRDLKVVLDKLVKPDLPIIDYKTEITGITAEDLENVTLTVADIQKKLRRFLTKGTILVGHSLSNDLKVLKIDHARVIDTANAFKYVNGNPKKKPSLNNLCKSVLGEEVRMVGAAHNCIHDAAAAMKLVLAVVEKGVDTTLTKTVEMIEEENTKTELLKRQLFLHKIPSDVTSEELQRAFTEDFTLNVNPSKKPGYYSANATFSSAEEANGVFENVDAEIVKDTRELPQKLFVFKMSSGSEASFYVRKNDIGNISKKRPNTEEENNVVVVNSKRQKREVDDSEKIGNLNLKLLKEIEEMKKKLESKDSVVVVTCEDHTKEIEKLKQQLKSKEHEVKAQDSIINNLRKKLNKK